MTLVSNPNDTPFKSDLVILPRYPVVLLPAPTLQLQQPTDVDGLTVEAKRTYPLYWLLGGALVAYLLLRD